MTCKECIHYDACNSWCNHTVETVCCHYKDKSRFIELPCWTGDTVYRILDVEWDIGEFEIYHSHLIQSDHTVVRFAAECLSHDIDEIVFYSDEIGEKVFLTREEAEKSLEEMCGK